MGICSRRHFLLTICSLQLITTIERQVFDFLGFMWAPILFNFFNIIFVILGFFGACQYRPKYIISYCIWNTLWLGWNIFEICFYLGVGVLDKKSDLLSFGTGGYSWWQTNGPGCKIDNEITEPEIERLSRSPNATDCILRYEVVEIMHASTQCILGIMAIVGGICLSRVFLEEDDSLRAKKRKKLARPLYRIEYTHSSQPEVVGGDESGVSPKPMTPRRVKRRSVISRDGTRRSSRRSSNPHRQSRRKNPVNRIIEHQENLYANTGPNGSISVTSLNYDRISGSWERKSGYWQPETVSTPSLVWPAPDPNYSNTSFHGASHSHSLPDPPPPPLPSSSSSAIPGNNSHNNNNNNQANATSGKASTRIISDNWGGAPCSGGELSPMQWHGQSNPSFQQTSTQSLNGEEIEDLYGNRPASARSSYSNYHGVRATPQVPTRTDLLRHSQRQFVLSGPPAYQDTVI